MSKGINKAIVIGNLGRDPETKYLPSGAAVTTFSIATSESWKDKQSGEKQERTEWHNIEAFGKLAEIAGEYLAKGSSVYIEGSLNTQNWEKEGVKHYRTVIKARDMKFLGERAERQAPAATKPAAPESDFDDDIPF